MSRTEVIRIRRPESVADDIARLNGEIMRRAYEIFEGRGGINGSDLDDWLSAERELVWKPAIELSEKNNEFLLTVAVPGVDPKDIQVEATTEDIVIKAEVHHEHPDSEGVHSCEFQCGSVFRTIHFPKTIDVNAIKAEFKHGILKIHAPVSEDQAARKIEISAA